MNEVVIHLQFTFAVSLDSDVTDFVIDIARQYFLLGRRINIVGAHYSAEVGHVIQRMVTTHLSMEAFEAVVRALHKIKFKRLFCSGNWQVYRGTRRIQVLS